MTLQEQRGKHSIAFFKGTHQCAHKVYPFADCTFDEFHAYFSQHDQDIPSPWGMPAFEIVEDDNFAEFLVTYNDYDTLATPDDFTGERMRAYIDHKRLCACLVCMSHAFPGIDEEKDYFG